MLDRFPVPSDHNQLGTYTMRSATAVSIMTARAALGAALLAAALGPAYAGCVNEGGTFPRVVRCTGAFAGGPGFSMAVGGAGGAGGLAEVNPFTTVSSLAFLGPQGSIQTGGLKSHGIQAQSVGGGIAGTVVVGLDGLLRTHGDAAVGLFAQSVGGCGGALGDFGTGLLGNWTLGSNGDTGDSGLVDVTVNGSVRTAGNNATGIFAQSAAGKGVAGMVSVTLTNSQILTGEILDPSLGGADLDASGNPLRGIGAVGIMAQSVGNAHNGNIVIAIDGADSVVRGGRSGFDLYGSEAPGVGVALIDGKDNTIVNHRLVTPLGGTDTGYAILAGGSRSVADPTRLALVLQLGGNETITNYGTITGSVDLGAGVNVFNNHGTFNVGRIVNLGVGGVLNNSGVVSFTGVAGSSESVLSDNFVQAASGATAV